MAKEESKNYIVQRKQGKTWYDWYMTPVKKEAIAFAKKYLHTCDDEIRVIKWTRTTITEEEEIGF